MKRLLPSCPPSARRLESGAAALAVGGYTALRFDWAYFTAKGRPSEDLGVEREDLDAAIAFVRTRPGVTRVVVAGKSLGSVVALDLALEVPEDLVAALFLTLPLHEPGNPTAKRPGTERLASLRLPAVVIGGADDPLCDMRELYRLAAGAKVPPAVVIVPGDHGLSSVPKDEAAEARNVEFAVSAMVQWVRRLTGG